MCLDCWNLVCQQHSPSSCTLRLLEGQALLLFSCKGGDPWKIQKIQCPHWSQCLQLSLILGHQWRFQNGLVMVNPCTRDLKKNICMIIFFSCSTRCWEALTDTLIFRKLFFNFAWMSVIGCLNHTTQKNELHRQTKLQLQNRWTESPEWQFKGVSCVMSVCLNNVQKKWKNILIVPSAPNMIYYFRGRKSGTSMMGERFPSSGMKSVGRFPLYYQKHQRPL